MKGNIVGCMRWWLVLVVVLFLFMIPGSVSGDGMFISSNRERVEVDLAQEDAQIAYIRPGYDKQEMLIHVNYQGSGDNETSPLWILPIPGDPEEIEVMATNHFPVFSASDYYDDGATEVNEMVTDAVKWPLLFGLPLYYASSLQSVSNAGDSGDGLEVEVRERFSGSGLVGSIISATNGTALHDYLAEQNMSLTSEMIPLFDHYIGDNFTFIVTEIDSSVDIDRGVGLFIRFEHGEPFFPMVLTSIYGETMIPIDIFIEGIYEAILPDGIDEGHIEVEYLAHWANGGSRHRDPDSFPLDLRERLLAIEDGGYDHERDEEWNRYFLELNYSLLMWDLLLYDCHGIPEANTVCSEVWTNEPFLSFLYDVEYGNGELSHFTIEVPSQLFTDDIHFQRTDPEYIDHYYSLDDYESSLEKGAIIIRFLALPLFVVVGTLHRNKDGRFRFDPIVTGLSIFNLPVFIVGTMTQYWRKRKDGFRPRRLLVSMAVYVILVVILILMVYMFLMEPFVH